MEFLIPVALKIFPNMLPSTFEDKTQKVKTGLTFRKTFILTSTHVKTHKLLQTYKQVVASLFTSCSQDVFALLVPNLLEQVWNKLLTNCNKLDGTIISLTRLFQQD